MPQADIRLSASQLSVEQTAAALQGLMAERAKERLGKVPAIDPLAEAPKTPAAPKPHEPGVYFNLPMADYHADPSLGSSDIKAMLVHPACYWQRSWMNPNREDSDTSAKKLGRALHTLVLEGEAAFDRTYAVEPSPAGYPGALVNQDDLKARCRALGEAVSGTKAELAKRIRAKDPGAIIFDDILAIFRAMVERDNLEVLKPAVAQEVRAAAANIKLNPHLAKAFTGGSSEVSVFWRAADGVPCKARWDYFKRKVLVGLKSFSNPRQRPVDVAVRLSIAEWRYDLQGRFHLDAYPHAFAAAREGRVFGDCPLPKDWEQQIVEPDGIMYAFVFHQIDGTPITVGRQVSAQSPALLRATREIETAKALYRRCLEQYGTAMWVADDPIVELAAADLPIWLREPAVEECV